MINWDDYTKNMWFFQPNAPTVTVGGVPYAGYTRVCSRETTQSLAHRAKWAKDNGLTGFYSWQLANRANAAQAEIRAVVREFEPSRVAHPLAPKFAGSRVKAVTGEAFSGVVAKATGSAASASALSAYINWGDLKRSSGTVVDLGDGNYAVEGTHVYAEPGTYTMTVVLFDTLDINTVLTNAWATVGSQIGLDQELEVTVTGADLSLEVPSAQTVDFGTVTLSGSNIIIRDKAMNNAFVNDARGTNDGWTLTGVASDFANADGSRRILAQNLGWYPWVEFAPEDDENLIHDPANVPMKIPGPPIWPGQYDGLSTTKTLCYAQGGVSTGRFDCSAELVLGVPWSTAAGNYTSVLTLTLI